MKFSREDVLDMAERAGYGIVHYGKTPEDGGTVNKWDKQLWGGLVETVRLQEYTAIVIGEYKSRVLEENRQMIAEAERWEAQ